MTALGQVTSVTNIEANIGNPATDGDVLSSTIAGVRSWITPSGGNTDVGFSAYIGTNQTTGNPLTQLAFNTVVYDTDSGFNTTTHKYTIPSTGKYTVSSSIRVSSNIVGYSLSVYVNGVIKFTSYGNNNSANDANVNLTHIGNFILSDLVEMKIATLSGQNFVIFASSAENRFAMQKIA